jgi:formylglycine-generating enzyme required for sulfatase activity
MVLIPAGEYRMGSPDSDQYALPREKPPHRVRITRPFYLGKYKVTQQQWQAVMDANPSHFKSPKNPVEWIRWSDCQAFLGKLDASHAKGKGRFALPTEAQWEYACRAGSTTRYCFGDDDGVLEQYAWQGVSASSAETHPVGEKRPNAWGLYDMHGNVWECCRDWFDENYYSQSPTDDPTGPANGTAHVIRGGCCYDPAFRCRSAHRAGEFGPGYPSDVLGFRVAFIPGDK